MLRTNKIQFQLKSMLDGGHVLILKVKQKNHRNFCNIHLIFTGYTGTCVIFQQGFSLAIHLTVSTSWKLILPQHASLTKKVKEEKLAGWGVLHKNRFIINLRTYLNRSQKNILTTRWPVKGESSLTLCTQNLFRWREERSRYESQ